jgi:hypothetical protein
VLPGWGSVCDGAAVGTAVGAWFTVDRRLGAALVIRPPPPEIPGEVRVTAVFWSSTHVTMPPARTRKPIMTGTINIHGRNPERVGVVGNPD